MSMNFKFRAKRIDNGEYIVGLFCRKKIGNLICPCIQIEKEYDNGDYWKKLRLMVVH